MLISFLFYVKYDIAMILLKKGILFDEDTLLKLYFH